MRIAMPARWARRLTPGAGAGGSDPADLPTPDELHNSKLLQWDSPFAGLLFVGIPSFYAFFAIQMGASNTTVGWLTSGPALLSLLWLIPCSQLIQRSRSFRFPIVAGMLLNRLFIVSLALIPLLAAGWRATGLVALVTLASLPLQYWSLAFDTMLGDMFSPRHFARLIGRRWAGIDLSGMLSVLLLGKMIDVVRFPLNWVLLTAGVGLLSFASVFIAARLRYPERHQPASDAGDDPVPKRPLGEVLRSNRAFIRLQVGVLLLYLALFAALPVLRIYWVRDLGASGAWVGGLVAAYSGGAVLGSLFWGPRSTPRFDRRMCLIGGLGAFGAYPVLTALFGSLPPQVAVVFLAGFTLVANDLMVYKRVLGASPRRQRATLVAIHNLTYNGVAFLGPLVSTELVAPLGTRVVLLLAGAVGVAGALFFYLFGWGQMTDATETQIAPE